MSYAVITAAQAKAIEQAACTQMNLPLLSLMQSAGEAAARLVQQLYPLGRVIVLCGPGGNGGDGYVVARLLLSKGVMSRSFLAGHRKNLPGMPRSWRMRGQPAAE